MKKFLMITTLIVSIALSAQVKAGLITVSVDKSSVGVGETVELTLNATNFDAFDFFDLTVNFDTTLFSFSAASLSSGLWGIMEANEVTSGVAISFVDFIPTSGDFLLAGFELTALESGSTNFDTVVNEFGLSDPFDIFAPATPVNAEVSGQAFTSVTSVPEPGMLSIMLLGLIALFGSNKKVISKKVY
jgi:hypothetical protein